VDQEYPIVGTVLAVFILTFAAGMSPLVLPLGVLLLPYFKEEWMSYFLNDVDRFTLTIVGPPLVAIVVYLVNGLFLLGIDLTLLASPVKIQPNKKKYLVQCRRKQKGSQQLDVPTVDLGGGCMFV
jgi:hypothetical protein